MESERPETLLRTFTQDLHRGAPEYALRSTAVLATSGSPTYPPPLPYSPKTRRTSPISIASAVFP